MTTEPNELTASINHERMPVLLSNLADFETWLSGAIVQSGSERKDLLEVA